MSQSVSTLPVATDPVHRYLLDPLERAAATFVQLFVVVLLASGAAAATDVQLWAKAADIAGFAAFFSLATSLATLTMAPLSIGADLAWRVVKTGLQAFLGVLVADQLSPGLVHANWSAALAVAVPATFFCLLKGLAALAAPWSAGASLLPLPWTATHQDSAPQATNQASAPQASAPQDSAPYDPESGYRTYGPLSAGHGDGQAGTQAGTRIIGGEQQQDPGPRG